MNVNTPVEHAKSTVLGKMCNLSHCPSKYQKGLKTSYQMQKKKKKILTLKKKRISSTVPKTFAYIYIYINKKYWTNVKVLIWIKSIPSLVHIKRCLFQWPKSPFPPYSIVFTFFLSVWFIDWVEVLRPTQPTRVELVSLSNHTFLGRLSPLSG